MTKSNSPHPVAVVVTYQPEFEILGQLLDEIYPQVESVVVVDNGSNVDLEAWNNQRQTPAVVLLLGENKGIAVAHNIGIQWALNKGAEFVLLMDQDSVPFPDMVEKLFSGLAQGDRQFKKPMIAAGPTSIDSRTGRESFFVTERNGIPRRKWVNLPSTSTNTITEVSSLISSGKLIDLKLLKSVRGMRSNYFIDHVDTEWCFRAKSLGYVLIGVNNAYMKHTLGDKVKNIWFFGWRHVAYHSPLRDYYMFRNTLLMCRDVSMSMIWRSHLVFRLLKFFWYFLLFTPQRGHRFYCMVLGAIHGLRGISGKLDLKTGRCSPVPKSDLDP